jgi:hypothetical protein
MVIVQLAVPSVPGTKAGHSLDLSEPAQQNLRVSNCLRKFFSLQLFLSDSKNRARRETWSEPDDEEGTIRGKDRASA